MIYLGFSLFSSLTSDMAPQGWVDALVILILMGGVNLVFTGVLSVYVWKIFDQIRARPIYIVREAIGLEHIGVTGPEQGPVQTPTASA